MLQAFHWPCAAGVRPCALCIHRQPSDVQVVLRAAKILLLRMLRGWHAEATQWTNQGDGKCPSNLGPVCSECTKHTHIQPAHGCPFKHHLAGGILDTHHGRKLTTHTQCTIFYHSFWGQFGELRCSMSHDNFASRLKHTTDRSPYTTMVLVLPTVYTHPFVILQLLSIRKPLISPGNQNLCAHTHKFFIYLYLPFQNLCACAYNFWNCMISIDFDPFWLT